ncbi:MAG: mRNA interferase MazF [Acetobacterium sp.]|jgi:mRNA-degrading endonuclease toxin of MazEF toxin-antitoxin module|uniref:type II toxin-antitoxin system PemK/MazF family toxin n=1 Tax=Acetobacterium sp. K1/6 TaxID=3055467 RepID=UPI0029E32ADE|nr:type II toxin-antitoxin system PemK/MazF family toxin [Acetobacterium sp. K1/6]MDK2942185.1 mRNA interferase MazF [Acetobacterium sp.]MDZ5723464.1 type II toxin-antitoxin system PemK/MazF family toxin [Acetobacterium sp. K1/6]
MDCKRGDIYSVDFGHDPKSKKQCGIRPVIVVSNNKANTHSPVITIVPLTSRTSKKRFQPTHVFIQASVESGLRLNSVALAEQVEAIDKEKLMCKIGQITDDHVMEKITKAIQIQIGVFEQYN